MLILLIFQSGIRIYKLTNVYNAIHIEDTIAAIYSVYNRSNLSNHTTMVLSNLLPSPLLVILLLTETYNINLLFITNTV